MSDTFLKFQSDSWSIRSNLKLCHTMSINDGEPRCVGETNQQWGVMENASSRWLIQCRLWVPARFRLKWSAKLDVLQLRMTPEIKWTLNIFEASLDRAMKFKTGMGPTRAFVGCGPYDGSFEGSNLQTSSISKPSATVSAEIVFGLVFEVRCCYCCTCTIFFDGLLVIFTVKKSSIQTSKRITSANWSLWTS